MHTALLLLYSVVAIGKIIIIKKEKNFMFSTFFASNHVRKRVFSVKLMVYAVFTIRL